MLDPYHDRRTGYEFSVNPAGVKSDYAIFNDGDEDVAWDAVWDAATRIDSLGWTAEYRIPLSQLHYSAKGGGTLRLPGLARRSSGTRRPLTWPLYRTSRSGLHLAVRRRSPGSRAWRARAARSSSPTWSTKNVPGPASDRATRRDQDVTVGGDLKYRLASNLLLNATVNPDFGQVEADPSELNLERLRDLLRRSGGRSSWRGRGCSPSPVNCVVVVDCNTGEGLFYSRRIGRSPQLADVYGDASSPDGDQDPRRGQGHRPLTRAASRSACSTP